MSIDLERKTIQNEKYYRHVIQTTKQMQLVLMNILPLGDIKKEVHPHTTQFIRVESGYGYAIVDGKRSSLSDGRAIIIPPGSEHYIKAGKKGMKLYTIYSPPEHKENEQKLN